MVMTRIRLSTALLCAAVLSACSKDGVKDITGPTAGSYVKFYNFAVNAPPVNFYANETKITAISSTACTPPATPPNPACGTTGVEVPGGVAYGAVGNGGLYSTIAPAQYSFSGRLSDTTAANHGFTVAKLSATLVQGKYYSLYTSGFYDAVAKNMDAFILEDAFPDSINYTASSVRFVNASSNSNPMTLYAKNTVTGDSVVIGSNVAYKSGGAFVTVPGAVYDLTVRYAGSNTAVITSAGVSFTTSRVYTVSARGDMTVVSTTATTRPILDVTANR
jgi:hypothetical protein